MKNKISIVHIRYLLLWVSIAGLIWLVLSKLKQVDELFHVLLNGKLIYILLAVFLQFAYYLIFSLIYKYSFESVGIKLRFKKLFPIVFASIFVNVIVPAGGASGLALFVDNAIRKGNTPARSTAGAVIAVIADLSVLFAILLVAIFFLLINKELRPAYIISFLILLLIIIFLVSIIVIGFFKPVLLTKTLNLFQKIGNFFGKIYKKIIFKEDWAKGHIEEFKEAIKSIQSNWRSIIKTLLITIGSFAVNIFSLYVIFLAYGYSVNPEILIVGFSMGILFWIISITPQGIGIVEGVMIAVFASSGVPLPIATAVSLSYRGLTFWLPLIIGFFTLRTSIIPKKYRVGNVRWSEIWSVRIAAVLTIFMGILNIISALTPPLAHHYQKIQNFVPLEVRHGGRLTLALSGFALFYLGINLWRRKRAAWLMTISILVISAVGHFIGESNEVEAVLALLLSGLLLIWSPHFHARSDQPSIKQGVKFLLWSIFFTLVYGTIGFYIFDHHFKENFGFLSALKQTLIMFFEFYNPGITPATRFGKFFIDSIYIIGFSTVGYAIISLLKPILIRNRVTQDERKRAESIIAKYGHTPLARFALFNDKYYFFSSGGSVIAFAVKGGIAISLGDPIGPKKDVNDSIVEFLDYCSRNGWQATFYQTLPDNLSNYSKMGFKHLHIGSEAIVDLKKFSLEGGEGRKLRKTNNRFTNLGYTIEFYSPPISKEILADLRIISDEWLTMVKGEEKKFSLGWFDDDYIKNSDIAVIRSPEGTIIGFINLVRRYSNKEISFDLMRRNEGTESGSMEFLFINLLLWAKDRKYEFFNFGLSPLSGVGKMYTDKNIEKALSFIYSHFNQFYNFKGLHTFKEKFHPNWSPRYLIYPNVIYLPSVAISIFRADSGDDFLWNYVLDFLAARKEKNHRYR